MHETGLLQATLAELTDRAGATPIRRVVLATGPGVDPAPELAIVEWRAT